MFGINLNSQMKGPQLLCACECPGDTGSLKSSYGTFYGASHHLVFFWLEVVQTDNNEPIKDRLLGLVE